MAQYVVHKIGFFYTDECYAPFVDESKSTLLSKVFPSLRPAPYKGSVLTIHKSLSDAKEAKRKLDIKALKKQEGNRASDFFFDAEDYDAVLSDIKAYYETQGWAIEDEDRFELPDFMTDKNAERLLKIMRFTFHEIVEYEDDFEIKKNNFGNLELEEF